MNLGKTNSKFFYNLEKNRYSSRVCSKLINSKKEEITSCKAILQMQHDYYMQLYKKDELVEFNLINRSSLYISEATAKVLNEPFSLEEMTTAIKQMSRNKTPGISGLTADFYKMYCGKLKTILYEAIQEIYNKRQLPKQLRTGIINLIPKASKDSCYLDHLRPISLLENEYKVIEKMMANRLELSLNEILSCDQKGFRKNMQNFRKHSKDL